MMDTDDMRQTTPGVRHKLPTGEVKKLIAPENLLVYSITIILIDLFSSEQTCS